MTSPTADVTDRLSNRLAQLLGYGTWASCGFVAAGMVWPMLGSGVPSEAEHLVSTGILLLIVLPTVRVATTGIWFAFHRDHDFALISGLVLVIIIATTLFGAAAG